MGDLRITDDWTPTVKNVEALLERLRKYIDDLRSNSDFRAVIRENAQLRNTNAVLSHEINQIRKDIRARFGRLARNYRQRKEPATTRNKKRAAGVCLTAALGHPVMLQLVPPQHSVDS